LHLQYNVAFKKINAVNSLPAVLTTCKERFPKKIQ